METEAELTLDTGAEPEPSLHRHPLNPVSLVFGILFLGLGLAFSFGDVDASDLSAGWVWAGALCAFGLLLVAAAAGRHRRTR